MKIKFTINIVDMFTFIWRYWLSLARCTMSTVTYTESCFSWQYSQNPVYAMYVYPGQSLCLFFLPQVRSCWMFTLQTWLLACSMGLWQKLLPWRGILNKLSTWMWEMFGHRKEVIVLWCQIGFHMYISVGEYLCDVYFFYVWQVYCCGSIHWGYSIDWRPGILTQLAHTRHFETISPNTKAGKTIRAWKTHQFISPNVQ